MQKKETLISPAEVGTVLLRHTEVRTLLLSDSPLDWWSSHCLCAAHIEF